MKFDEIIKFIMRIQEIAEELVNLSVQEVNELAMVMKNDFGIPAVSYKEPKYRSNKDFTPKQYGQMKNYKYCKR